MLLFSAASMPLFTNLNRHKIINILIIHDAQNEGSDIFIMHPYVIHKKFLLF